MKKKYNSKKNKKQQKSKVIICVEDKCSFTNYLKGLFNDTFSINKTNMFIDGLGCDPRKLYTKCLGKIRRNDFDIGYIVFDKDNHSTYRETINKCDNNMKINYVFFNPCSEYLLYLHLADDVIPNKINSKEMQNQLLDYIPSYEKNKKREFFIDTFINITKNDVNYYQLCKAYYLLQENYKKGSTNKKIPTSNFHMFIDEMIELFPTELKPLYNALNKYKKLKN